MNDGTKGYERNCQRQGKAGQGQAKMAHLHCWGWAKLLWADMQTWYSQMQTWYSNKCRHGTHIGTNQQLAIRVLLNHQYRFANRRKDELLTEIALACLPCLFLTITAVDGQSLGSRKGGEGVWGREAPMGNNSCYNNWQERALTLTPFVNPRRSDGQKITVGFLIRPAKAKESPRQSP